MFWKVLLQYLFMLSVFHLEKEKKKKRSQAQGSLWLSLWLLLIAVINSRFVFPVSLASQFTEVAETGVWMLRSAAFMLPASPFGLVA